MGNVVRLEYAYGVCPKCNRGDYLRYLIRNDGLIHKPYEIKCINCNSYFTKKDILGRGEETAPKTITNADRIRSMSDEKLARWIALHPCLPSCPAQTEECFKTSKFESCTERWLNWLRQEVSDG